MVATLTGMPVETFELEVRKWIETARHPRWNRPYTDLAYQPMLEVLQYLRANGYRTYIVTGGGQDFVREYSERVYGIPREQVVGTAGGTKYGYDKDGRPFLTKEPKLLLNDNDAGKPEGIYLEIGRRPYAAFGNSTGDRQMLEYVGSGDGARLMMLLLHDDGEREYAYGPAQGLPDTKVGTFTQSLYDEAKTDGWTVISMKNDWSAFLLLIEFCNAAAGPLGFATMVKNAVDVSGHDLWSVAASSSLPNQSRWSSTAFAAVSRSSGGWRTCASSRGLVVERLIRQGRATRKVGKRQRAACQPMPRRGSRGQDLRGRSPTVSKLPEEC